MLTYRFESDIYFYQTSKTNFQNLISGKKRYIVFELENSCVYEILRDGKVKEALSNHLKHGDILRVFYGNKTEEEEKFIVLNTWVDYYAEILKKTGYKKVYPECRSYGEALRRHYYAKVVYVVEVELLDESLDWLAKYTPHEIQFSHEVDMAFEKAFVVYKKTLKNTIWENFDFCSWYYKKVVPGIINHTYMLVMYCNNEEVKGLAIAKTNQEFTEFDVKFLWVDEKYRRLGIANKLIDVLKLSLSVGGNYYLTIPAELESKFEPFVEELGFEGVFKDCKIVKYGHKLLYHEVMDTSCD